MTIEIQSNLVIHRQNGGKAAVIFLHGFSGDPLGTWAKFPSFLTTDNRLKEWDIYSLGYTTTLSFDVVGIWSADPPLDSVADLLRTRCGVMPLKDYRALVLIAHSMGGLVVQRAMLDDPTFAKRVSHLILFGTPSNGLVKARFFEFWKRQFNNMAADGAFIKDLRERWNDQLAPRLALKEKEKRPFAFLAIAGDQDEFVPRTSSIDPFPLEFRRVVVGNHVEIVKPDDARDPNVQLVLDCVIGEAADSGPMNAAAVAVESREFQQAIAILWPKDKSLGDVATSLDKVAAVRLALALDGVGRASDAMELLKKSRHMDDTDAMGVLAGRLKRRWIVERVEDDAVRARVLYTKAYELSASRSEHAQAFYHGINVAFLDLVYGNKPQQAKEMATKVLQHCAQAERDIWRVATEAEACLYLGEFDTAVKRYSEVVPLNPKPWEERSMLKQAVVVARHLKKDDLEKRITAALLGREA